MAHDRVTFRSQVRQEKRDRAQGNEKKERISLVTAGLLISTAVFFDGVQFAVSFTGAIPVVGMVFAPSAAFFISIFANCIFFTWFLCLGVMFTKSNKMVATRLLIIVGEVLVELVPFINALPALTLSVVAMIFLVKIEDATGIQAKKWKAKDVGAVLTAAKNLVPMVRFAALVTERKRKEVEARARKEGRQQNQEAAAQELAARNELLEGAGRTRFSKEFEDELALGARAIEKYAREQEKSAEAARLSNAMYTTGERSSPYSVAEEGRRQAEFLQKYGHLITHKWEGGKVVKISKEEQEARRETEAWQKQEKEVPVYEPYEPPDTSSLEVVETALGVASTAAHAQEARDRAVLNLVKAKREAKGLDHTESSGSGGH